MGLLPLAIGMPGRFTDTVDKERKIFKGTAGKLVGIVLEDSEYDRIATVETEEIVLQKQPVHLLIELCSNNTETNGK